jgi:BASS family bile acid:Na+ symporter
MEGKFLLDIFLPVALGIIMLGLGLTLTIADFKRVVVFPRAVIVGLACQMLILPVVCFFVARSFGLTGAMAVGLMLLAASPGGATANLYSHLAKGDVALNITLTAVNSVLTLITLPLIVNFSIEYFMGTEGNVTLQFRKVVEVFAIVLIPVSLGMFIRGRSVHLAARMDKPVKILSAIFLIIIIVGAVANNKDIVVKYFGEVGMAALAFNLLSMGAGFFLPLLAKVTRKQAIAIGMEIGIHNGTLAIYIANNALNNEAMSFPPAIYSLIMFFTAAAFGFIVSRKHEEKAA